MARVLIADDDRNLRQVLLTEIAEEGHEVTAVASGPAALERLAAEEYDVVLLDLNMPGLGGLDVLKQAGALDLAAEIVVLTGHASVSVAVDAMKLGAYDFLTKPFKLAELLAVIQKAVEKKRLRRENLLLRAQLQRQAGEPEIVARSAAFREILADVERVAASDYAVLVQGESGAGKEVVARALHRSSTRASGPFVPLNCGAIPESMLESELFGHEKGAFTGAQSRKPGLLEVADRGTLFLDEIGELPLALQVKFLRVLETGTFFRLGGVKEVRVSVRCVSASNKDIKEEAARGRFRRDLYYRISALTIAVPPLRERREDIPALIEHFRLRDPRHRGASFSPGALALLCAYSWPGNVRELQNVVSRALLLARDGVVREQDLPQDLSSLPPARPRRLEDVEREHILAVLREAGGQRGKAAEILGIDPKTLYRKLAGYQGET